MSTLIDPARAKQPAGARAPAGLFRAFWRWHFYASFVVIPVFALLSVTGPVP